MTPLDSGEQAAEQLACCPRAHTRDSATDATSNVRGQTTVHLPAGLSTTAQCAPAKG